MVAHSTLKSIRTVGAGKETNTVYDLIVIGASTTGAYLAHKIASAGFKVKVIEKLPRESVGSKYDIFHIMEPDFALHGLPRPVKGDPAWAFEFLENLTADPFDVYRRNSTGAATVGLHMGEYTRMLCDRAAAAGAEIGYGAEFTDFVFENGRIAGVKYVSDGELHEERALMVADCSGIPAVGRTALPYSYGIDTDRLSGGDMFYVVLRYIKFKNEKDYIKGSCGWPFYKTWIAPCQDPEGAILGIGATNGFDHCDEVWERFVKNVPLPEYELDYIERGATPYTTPPYSFVADNFIVCGDAACLTKPMNGEGVTSSMVQIDAAMPVLVRSLKYKTASKRDLWSVNKIYNRVQGADFAATRALLTVVVNSVTIDDFYNVFAEGVVSDEILASDLQPSFADLAAAAGKFASAAARGRFSGAALAAAAKAVRLSGALKKHYLAFPDDPADFDSWCERADSLWQKVGKME